MVVVPCQCGSRFRVGDQWLGKQARCPVCRAVVAVPLSVATAESSGSQFAPPSNSASNASDRVTDDRPEEGPQAKPAPTPPRRVPSTQTRSGSGEPVPRSEDMAIEEPPLPVGTEFTVDVLLRRLVVSTVAVGVVTLAGLGFYAYSTSTTRDAEGMAVVDPAHAAVTEEIGDPGRSPVEGNLDTQDPSPIEPPESPAAPDEPVANVDPEVAVDPPRERPTPPEGNDRVKQKKGGGLSSISSQYDDFHCQRIQSQFGWRVPVAAEFLEVDGVRLPLTNLDDLRKARAPYLFLPRGDHAIRLRGGEQPIRTEVTEHLESSEAAMREFFGVGGVVNKAELLARGARTMDVHGAPFLLNMTGAAYIGNNEWEAAERKFRRALVVNPLFAPAHLNLSVCLFNRGDQANAVRELRLAETLNVGNVFGLAGAVTRLRQSHNIADADEAIELNVGRYVSRDTLTEEDRRLTALMTAMSKYAVREEDRGKILNNLAVHFSDTGKVETALEHFRLALGEIKLAGPDRFALAEKVLSHMESACREAGFPEAEEYAFMRKSVLP